MEVWKQTKYNGYEVSNCGQIKSLARIVPQGNRTVTVKETILKQMYDKRGYPIVNVRVNAKTISCRVHRLVAETFIDNPNNLPQVNHKDGCKLNSFVSNLEWCTNQDNAIHAFETGLRVSPKGEQQGLSKLSESDVRHARELCVSGISTSKIAVTVGLNKASCREMLIGKTWKHVNYLIEECKAALTSRIGRNQHV